MKHFLFLFLAAGFCFLPAGAQNPDSVKIRQIYDYYLSQSHCYANLEVLSTRIGARLSGSPQAEQAVTWAKKAMYEAGADTVFLQPCLVPHWVRGKKELCTVTSASQKTPLSLNCLALGSSVGTGSKGISAEVVEVSSFQELDRLDENAVRGKIVFFNVFFDHRKIHTGSAYRDAVEYRVKGASRAAKRGAIACVVRSVTSLADDAPHTGNMSYDTSVSRQKIPAVALSYKAADDLHELVVKKEKPVLYLETHCENLPPTPSFNVVGQINGSEKPNEFVIAGGHLDSWDVGQGAHDDGAGVVQCMDVLSAFKASGIKPRHSIRAVAFMNEENGLAGGNAYAKFAKEKNEKHIAALETDAGGFTPRGFLIDTTNGLYNMALNWKSLFKPYYIDRFEMDGGGSDLHALEKTGVPCIGFEPDSQRYFDIHHSASDTFDKINKRELELGGAAIAALIYLIDQHCE